MIESYLNAKKKVMRSEDPRREAAWRMAHGVELQLLVKVVIMLIVFNGNYSRSNDNKFGLV